MFKKLKKYIELKRRERIETLETLSTICLFLGRETRGKHGIYGEHFASHFRELKSISEELRK